MASGVACPGSHATATATTNWKNDRCSTWLLRRLSVADERSARPSDRAWLGTISGNNAAQRRAWNGKNSTEEMLVLGNLSSDDSNMIQINDKRLTTSGCRDRTSMGANGPSDAALQPAIISSTPEWWRDFDRGFARDSAGGLATASMTTVTRRVVHYYRYLARAACIWHTHSRICGVSYIPSCAPIPCSRLFRPLAIVANDFGEEQSSAPATEFVSSVRQQSASLKPNGFMQGDATLSNPHLTQSRNLCTQTGGRLLGLAELS